MMDNTLLNTIVFLACFATATSAYSELDDLPSADVRLLGSLTPGWEVAWEPELLKTNVSERFPPIGRTDEIFFLLWTRDLRPGTEYLLIPNNTTNIEESPFDGSRRTFVHFHGFNAMATAGWILDSKDELLKQFDCNVISVDYSALVLAPYYVRSVLNVYKVAEVAASFLDWLSDEFGLDLSKLHLLGSSLGAHTAGMTGQYISKGTVSRVTGLDPAGPLFYHQPDNLTISKRSAEFVDVIHTNGGNLLEGCLGLFRPVGHVDFYPNGGVHQAGCIVEDTLAEDILDAFEQCSHHRATPLWVESIRAQEPDSLTFYSHPCPSWGDFEDDRCTDCGDLCQLMGFPAEGGHPGTFYLRTNAVSPFARGEDDSGGQGKGEAPMLLGVAYAIYRTYLKLLWH